VLSCKSQETKGDGSKEMRMFSSNCFKAVRYTTLQILSYTHNSFFGPPFAFLCLISDEPDEVEFVKKALAEHLDLDPQVTLGVLCDQIVPMGEAADEEEQNIRDRLRALVISFLTGRAKRAIVERHASKPGSEAEQVLVGGLTLVSRFRKSSSSFVLHA
jgi:hypothetical protein